MVDYNDARKRNLKIKIFKAYFAEEKRIENNFNKEEIKSIFYFKESDMIHYFDIFFKKMPNDSFRIKKEIEKELQSFKKKHNEHYSQREALKNEYISLYNSLKGSFVAFKSDMEIIKRDMPKAIEIACKIHYIYAPIYSEQMIINRGCLPESDLKDYYNHFHAIEDLYYELIGRGKEWRSIEGDINLNQEMSFKVYTTRWGHYDTYRIKRTYEGWYVEHIAINGKAEKNGRGALQQNLRQDSIFYPIEGVEHAFETLWDDADKIEMSVEELQHRLQQIADWISEVEIITHKYQPDWCLYY